MVSRLDFLTQSYPPSSFNGQSESQNGHERDNQTGYYNSEAIIHSTSFNVKGKMQVSVGFGATIELRYDTLGSNIYNRTLLKLDTYDKRQNIFVAYLIGSIQHCSCMYLGPSHCPTDLNLILRHCTTMN